MNEFGCASRCNCLLRPRCETRGCRRPADWSVYTPPTRRIFGPYGRLMFLCNPCLVDAAERFRRPLKGLDAPPNASEDWRPSLMDHLRWARVDAEHERHQTVRVIPREKQDPAWLAKVDRMFADAVPKEVVK